MKDLLIRDGFDLSVSYFDLPMGQFSGGDLIIGDSQDQSISLLMATSPGQWRESPTAGIGLSDLILTDITDLKKKHTINVQLRADGAKVRSLKFTQEEIEIDAVYED